MLILVSFTSGVFGSILPSLPTSQLLSSVNPQYLHNYSISWYTHVWWQIEISQCLDFFSTYIFTFQKLMEGPVKILFHIPNRFPNFWRGYQKCAQGTPPWKPEKAQRCKCWSAKLPMIQSGKHVLGTQLWYENTRNKCDIVKALF